MAQATAEPAEGLTGSLREAGVRSPTSSATLPGAIREAHQALPARQAGPPHGAGTPVVEIGAVDDDQSDP